MKKKSGIKVLLAVIVLLLVIVLSDAFYTVQENEYACTLRFSKFETTVTSPGLYVKLPFVDTVKKFPKTIMLYDINPSEVQTADNKIMTVDSYVLWTINNPQTFYQSLGSLGEAEVRLNAVTYTALKNHMGTLEQNAIINQDDASERNDIYEAITLEVAEKTANYGISITDVKVKRLDLPTDNEQAVYDRMISDRTQIAEKYTADGAYEASIIRNDVDKQVNIIVSNAEAEAAAIEAEGEREYMQILADAYDTEEKRAFYEFQLSLDALRDTLGGDAKTIILGKDSPLVQTLIDPMGE
ncbi:MAG: protease modulator HflC [Ruminococcaceae bacterium]|nr:protease modulator HflC [Oscillospiraceae bacterium]